MDILYLILGNKLNTMLWGFAIYWLVVSQRRNFQNEINTTDTLHYSLSLASHHVPHSEWLC